MIHVFLVDDHTILRDGLHYILDAQHDISVVGDAADGLTASRQAKELCPDMVVMDISMPHENSDCRRRPDSMFGT